jgi:hypothetical protein
MLSVAYLTHCRDLQRNEASKGLNRLEKLGKHVAAVPPESTRAIELFEELKNLRHVVKTQELEQRSYLIAMEASFGVTNPEEGAIDIFSQIREENHVYYKNMYALLDAEIARLQVKLDSVD